MKVLQVSQNNYPNRKKPSFGFEVTQHFINGLVSETYIGSYTNKRVIPLIDELVTELEKQKKVKDGFLVELNRYVHNNNSDSLCYDVTFKHKNPAKGKPMQTYKNLEGFLQGFTSFLRGSDDTGTLVEDAKKAQEISENEISILVGRIKHLN